ncbi:MAG TPA: CpXC domain-containing protein [Stellaceae bacterium]|nr:CpXC domain-containing protein [Stellaceae bacterium]
MSLFVTQDIPCPACGKPVEFNVNFSVNADRRPDFRTAILNGSFQVEECEHCETEFRLEPEMTYLDMGRHQWILVRPASKRHEWPALEEDAQSTFDLAYGEEAPPAARAIGTDLAPRVTFGWAALREKVICAEEGLDDATLEILKILLMRTMLETPLRADTEFRLGGIEDGNLNLAWIRFDDEVVVETMSVPRGLYDDIAAAPQAWQALREELTAGTYVDVTRLLVDTEAPAEAA